MVLHELLNSDAGLMSLAVIAFMLGMGAFMFFKFRAFIRDEASRNRKD